MTEEQAQLIEALNGTAQGISARRRARDHHSTANLLPAQHLIQQLAATLH